VVTPTFQHIRFLSAMIVPLSESVSYPSASCQRNPVAAFPVDTASEELVVTSMKLLGSPSGGSGCGIDEEDDEVYSFAGEVVMRRTT
jgi:hypothetical protein